MSGRGAAMWQISIAVVIAVAVAACQPAPEPTTPRDQEPRPVPGRGPAEVVPDDLVGPEACADAPLLTLEQVARGERAGERVAFDVVPAAEIMCTLLACVGADGKHDEHACCNRCGGGYHVYLPERFRLQFANLGGCGGWDCNLRCDPFGTAPTRTYRFVGTSAWSKRLDNGAIYDKSTFTVERYCAVEAR